MPGNKDHKLLELMVDNNIINQDKSEEIKKEVLAKGSDLNNFLIEKKIASEEEITKLRAEIYGLPYINLLDREIPEPVLNFISEEVAHTYRIICFAKENKSIKIGLT